MSRPMTLGARCSGWIAAPLAALLVGGQSAPVVPSVTVTYPFQGVTYLDRVERTPRDVHLRVVQIDLATPGIRFKLSSPAGRREVVRQTTLEYLKQEGAQ